MSALLSVRSPSDTIHHQRGCVDEHQGVLAQQQDTISVGQSVLIASIPAAIALVGVIVTIYIGQQQARRASEQERTERHIDRHHQVRLERDRLLRAERISLHRRLAEAASEMLGDSAQAALREVDEPSIWADRTDPYWRSHIAWTGVLAEARFLAADTVTEAALHSGAHPSPPAGDREARVRS